MELTEKQREIYELKKAEKILGKHKISTAEVSVAITAKTKEGKDVLDKDRR